MIKGWYSRPTTRRAKRRLFWNHPFYKNFRPKCYNPVVNPWFTSPTAWFLSTNKNPEFLFASNALGFKQIKLERVPEAPYAWIAKENWIVPMF